MLEFSSTVLPALSPYFTSQYYHTTEMYVCKHENILLMTTAHTI